MGNGDEDRPRETGKTREQRGGLPQWFVLHPSGKEHTFRKELCHGFPARIPWDSFMGCW